MPIAVARVRVSNKGRCIFKQICPTFLRWRNFLSRSCEQGTGLVSAAASPGRGADARTAVAKHLELVDINSGHWPMVTRPRVLVRLLRAWLAPEPVGGGYGSPLRRLRGLEPAAGGYETPFHAAEPPPSGLSAPWPLRRAAKPPATGSEEACGSPQEVRALGDAVGEARGELVLAPSEGDEDVVQADQGV